MLSGFYAAYIAAVAGIDLDSVAGVDEQGYAYGCAGLHSGGLQGVCGGVSLDAGLGVGHLKDGLGGHLGIEHGVGAGVADNLHNVTLLHEVGSCDEFLGDGHLVECLLVHEDVVAAICIEILVGAALHTHVLEFFADVEAALEHAAVDDVLQFCAHEGVALAGLHVEEFYTEV